MGGGGAGCSPDKETYWSEAGEVTVDVITLNIEKGYHNVATVGDAQELVNSPAGSASPPLPDNTFSLVFGVRAEGGSCTLGKKFVNPQTFEHFFMSTISYGKYVFTGSSGLHR